MPASRLQFDPAISMEDVQATLALALIATEALYGREAVALSTFYRFDSAARSVEIELSSTAATALARIFLGFCHREFGAQALAVCCTKGGA